jgi:hypothetical protein
MAAPERPAGHGRGGSGYVRSVAGYENRRGQDPNAPGGYPPYPAAGHPGHHATPGHYAAPGQYPAPGEPEYLGQAQAYDDAPGHTRAFTMGEPAQLAEPYPYGGDNVATYRGCTGRNCSAAS